MSNDDIQISKLDGTRFAGRCHVSHLTFGAMCLVAMLTFVLCNDMSVSVDTPCAWLNNLAGLGAA